jgi:hypothetical protein
MDMAEPARLTSALLARKGQALPTGGFAHAKLALIPPQPTDTKADRECCGLPASSATPSVRVRRPARQPGPAAADRVAFTLRLDRERHVRLKVLAARRGRSGQEMLLRALDAYLEACAADCPCLRGVAPPRIKSDPARP